MPFLWPVTAWNNLKYTCVELLYIESLFFPPDSNKNIHFQNWSGRQFTTYCLLPERPRFGLKIKNGVKCHVVYQLQGFYTWWCHFRQLFLRLGFHAQFRPQIPTAWYAWIRHEYQIWPYTCYILFHSILDMPMSFLAAIFISFGLWANQELIVSQDAATWWKANLW